jgi:hypothetical protein
VLYELSFELAKAKTKQMELDIKKNPDKYPEGGSCYNFFQKVLYK